MKTIPLTRGKFALINDEDVEIVSNYKWHAHYDGYNWYAKTNIKGINGKQSMMAMHRLLMGCIKGDGKIIDHKDGNGLNNQRCNIRFATPSQNVANKEKTRGSSKYLGVYFSRVIRREFRKRTNDYRAWVSTCWIAQIRVNGKIIHLGRHKEEKSAALAYNEAAKIHHKEFARLNIIEK